MGACGDGESLGNKEWRNCRYGDGDGPPGFHGDFGRDCVVGEGGSVVETGGVSAWEEGDSHGCGFDGDGDGGFRGEILE